MVPDENSVEISTFSIACFSLISGRKKKIPTETIYQDRSVNIIIIDHKFIKSLFSTQQTFTCPKSTIETIEKGVRYVQS